MKVQEVMRSPEPLVAPEATLAEVARLMSSFCLSTLPVVDSAGRLVGVVRDIDLVPRPRGVPFSLVRFPALFGEWFPGSRLRDVYAANRERPVAEVMRPPGVVVAPHDEVDAVTARLAELGIDGALVLDRGQLVGIVSRRDVVRVLAGQC